MLPDIRTQEATDFMADQQGGGAAQRADRHPSDGQHCLLGKEKTHPKGAFQQRKMNHPPLFALKQPICDHFYYIFKVHLLKEINCRFDK